MENYCLVSEFNYAVRKKLLSNSALYEPHVSSQPESSIILCDVYSKMEKLDLSFYCARSITGIITFVMSLLALTLKPAPFSFASCWLQEKGGQESFLEPIHSILKRKKENKYSPLYLSSSF